MANFTQFEIGDAFSKRDYVKLPNSMRFDKSIKEVGILYRLLVGSATLTNNVTGEVYNQNQNYSILGKKAVSRFTKKMFLDFFSSGTTLAKVDACLKRSNPNNIPLFKDLISEFCYYFYYTEKDLHTLSFLHIYRILERISFTYPMMYASRATDYVGTFSKIQNYFKNSASELKFLNLFVAETFEDELLNYPVKINITACNEEVREKYFKTLRGLCVSNDPTIEIKDMNEFSDLTFENKNTFNLMIHLRNRYFHFASGAQRNISTTELVEPNDFFGLLNEHFINWLSVTFFQMIKMEMNR